ncbi:MAG: DUF2933 domain-containing protein [Bacillus sp. (in: firmicutes)]
MEWLLLLICPIMMLFMMKGMGGHGHHKNDHDTSDSKVLDTKLSKLELENEKLKKEIDALSTMVKKES